MVNARCAALALVAAMLAGCAPRLSGPSHTVAPAMQLDLLRLPRVWLAGFVADGDAKVDLSEETARLLGQQLAGLTLGGVVSAGVLALPNEEVFGDRDYWQQVGEEHGSPLIITGSVQLRVAPAVAIQRGRRADFKHGTGRVLQGTLVLIDGRTGAVVATAELPQRIRYADVRAWSPDTLYYELMDVAMPDWLAVLSTMSRPLSVRKP
jgi:ribosomal protein L35AE/L33A